uniref:MCM3-like winged helix domain-containing protein n=1 Tax=Mucochytrium quahogii TaxID=96639 RepID=A0A7S2RR60_9STRA
MNIDPKYVQKEASIEESGGLGPGKQRQRRVSVPPASNACFLDSSTIEQTTRKSVEDIDPAEPSSVETNFDIDQPQNNRTENTAGEEKQDILEPTNVEQNSEGQGHRFKKGQVVTIASRTQPGMNKPGGTARLTKLNPDGTYNVKYVLGGGERNVEETYISTDSDGVGEKPRSPPGKNIAPASLEKQKVPSTMNATSPGVAKTVSAKPSETKSETHTNKFSVGQVVNVASRTQPGMNKPGGTGRVQKVNDDGTYNVKYVLGGTERNVAEHYISDQAGDDATKRSVAAKTTTQVQEKDIDEMSIGVESVEIVDSERKKKKARIANKKKPKQSRPANIPSLKEVAKSQGIPQVILDPKKVIKTNDPKELARQQSFTQLVSKVFRHCQTDSMESNSLQLLINKENIENGPFTDAEFKNRLQQLDTENRVMIQEKFGASTVYLV